ncbi:MAG: hypothetical protein RL358_349 [Pseudomonadota bacterium]|jgi:hypothetical protein
MNWLTTKIPTKLAAVLVSASVLGLASQTASALTASGVSISNTASLTYQVGGTTQTPIASSPLGNNLAGTAGTATTFMVDKKADFTVTGTTTTNVAPGQLAVLGQAATAANSNTVLVYTVTNLGNDPQGFTFVAANATPVATTDVFDPTAFQIFVETDGVAGYSAGDTATAIANLPAGSSVQVYVLSNIPLNSVVPAPLVNGNQALVTLSATITAPGTPAAPSLVAGTAGLALVASNAAAGSNATGGANVNTVDVVFADAANILTGSLATPVDAANNGKVSANSAYTVQSAMLTVTKLSHVICDPVSGTVAPNNIPGAAIQWAITITNAAAATVPANLALPNAISDPLDVHTTLDPNKVQGAAAPAAALCLGSPAFATLNGLGYTLGTAAPAPGAAPATLAPAGALFLNGAAVTAAPAAGGTVTVNFASLLPASASRLVAGNLNPGEFITVYFNAFVN